MASIIERACDSIPEFRQKYEKFSKELHVQQYSSGTITGYCHQLATLCFHFKKVPEDLSQEEVRDYLSCLSSGNSCKISKFKHTIYSLRCYRKMMSLSAWHFSLPRIRKSKKLPVVFSCEEILLFLSSCEGLRSRAIFSLIYSCGLRVSELRHMQISHIDSRRMQVLIYQGKGKKDRYVPLSAQTLLDLRAYFSRYQPKFYLFNSTPGHPISEEVIRTLFREAVLLAGIRKPCTLHTLRHSYATHLLEFGENLLRIRDLLGHTNITTTMTYLHISRLEQGGKSFSPLDRVIAGVNQPHKDENDV